MVKKQVFILLFCFGLLDSLNICDALVLNDDTKHNWVWGSDKLLWYVHFWCVPFLYHIMMLAVRKDLLMSSQGEL